jgi:hypothetical protein
LQLNGNGQASLVSLNINLEAIGSANVYHREDFMGTTADKIAKAITAQERNGVIDLSSYRATKASINEAHLDKDRLGEWLNGGYDPAHAVFIYTQNFASFLSEQMSTLKELREFARIVGKARDEYIPSFPPMSPLTTSYFTMWALFDVLFGQSHETIGTCLQRIAKDISFPGWLLDAINAMQESRMGFHIHCGFEDRYVRLREIGTGDIKRCYSSSGYKGTEGQIWFGRPVAPSNSLVTYHVVMTTPYVLVGTTEKMISAYLAREIARLGGKPLPHGMDTHTFIMKHGPSPSHWNEYIFCAYSNFQRDAVFISGIPDMKESLPCAS